MVFPITTHIKFGDGLSVTDLGNEVIRVDAASAGKGLLSAAPRWIKAANGGYCDTTDDGWGLSPNQQGFVLTDNGGNWSGETNDRTGSRQSWNGQTDATWTGSIFKVTQNGGRTQVSVVANAPPGVLLWATYMRIINWPTTPATNTTMSLGVSMAPNNQDIPLWEWPVVIGFNGQDRYGWPTFDVIPNRPTFSQNANYQIANHAGLVLTGTQAAIQFNPSMVQSSGTRVNAAISWTIVHLRHWA
jgi:hypothetical protein